MQDPNGIDQHELGAKLDLGKPKVRTGLIEKFPRACIEISKVSEYGEKKYSRDGWRFVDNGIERYGDACERHEIAEILDGPYDNESGLLHAAHEAWNAIARLELILIDIQGK